jgi:daunorubicin resistance ABC transporter ATP-binding subunit
MTDAAIVAEQIGKRFGPVPALEGVDLVLPAGGVLGLLGPNGAGKTTMVRVLATLLRPDRGRARVAGFDVAEQPQEVRRRIGLSGQYAAVDPFLTGQENLAMIGRLYGLPARQAGRRAGDLIGQLGLAGTAGRLARTYSGGMRRRLDVAASLVAAPPVLFLDEPTTGLDPRGRLALWQVLGELAGTGTSVLLTTQYIEEAERLASMIVIIDHGTVIASGTPGQLRDRAGGDRLDLQAAPGEDPRQLAGAIATLGTGEPVVDEAAGRVILPVADLAATLPAVAARLAATRLHVSALAVRRPTLEEAFLALTGQPSGSPPAPGRDAAGPAAARPGAAYRTRSAQ